MERTADAGGRTASYGLLATEPRGTDQQGSPMYARIITFHLDGPAAAGYHDHVAAVAPAFTAWPGLVAKVWIADEATATYGGIYLFSDLPAAERSRETDLFRSMATNPAFRDLAIREFDVLDEPTAITAAALAAVHPPPGVSRGEVGGAPPVPNPT
jgi:hypothetical protein